MHRSNRNETSHRPPRSLPTTEKDRALELVKIGSFKWFSNALPYRQICLSIVVGSFRL